MLAEHHHVKQAVVNEQLRLTLAIAIIAATIGIFTLDSEKHSFAVILQGFTLLPSLMLGLYMIFTAAHLKYKRVGEMGDLSIPEKLRRWSYDTGVSLFWYMFLTFTIIFVAGLFGWDGDTRKFLEFWPSFTVSFVILALLVVVSAVITRREGGHKKERSRSLKMFRRKK